MWISRFGGCRRIRDIGYRATLASWRHMPWSGWWRRRRSDEPEPSTTEDSAITEIATSAVAGATLEQVSQDLSRVYESIAAATGSHGTGAVQVAALKRVLEKVKGLEGSTHGGKWAFDGSWLEELDEDDGTRNYLKDLVTDGQSTWDPDSNVRTSISRWLNRARRKSLASSSAQSLGVSNVSFLQQVPTDPVEDHRSEVEIQAFEALQLLMAPGSGVLMGGCVDWVALPTSAASAATTLQELEVRLLRPKSVLGAVHGSQITVQDWAFDVVVLDEQTGGHCLALVFPFLLRRHGLPDELPLDQVRLHAYLHELERRYGNNPYHNRMHGCDVLLGVHRFLTEFGLVSQLSSLHRLAALFAAMVHDFCHPGTSNAFEVKTLSEKALRFSDASVLEHHHLESAFSTLHKKGFNFLHGLSRDDYSEFRRTVIAMVLHTDLKSHFEFINRLKGLPSGCLSTAPAKSAADEGISEAPSGNKAAGSFKRGGGSFASRSESKSEAPPKPDVPPPVRPDNALMLAVAIKLADLGHSLKPWDQHKRWSEWVTEEFYLLGDVERALPGEVKISPLCDRHKDTDLPKSQMGFFNFVVLPFATQVARILPEAEPLLAECQRNLKTWEAMAERAKADSDRAKADAAAKTATEALAVKPNATGGATRLVVSTDDREAIPPTTESPKTTFRKKSAAHRLHSPSVAAKGNGPPSSEISQHL